MDPDQPVNTRVTAWLRSHDDLPRIIKDAAGRLGTHLARGAGGRLGYNPSGFSDETLARHIAQGIDTELTAADAQPRMLIYALDGRYAPLHIDAIETALARVAGTDCTVVFVVYVGTTPATADLFDRWSRVQNVRVIDGPNGYEIGA